MEQSEMLDYVLSCVAAYAVGAGLFLIWRKDAVWNYQQQRRLGVGKNAAERSPQWEAAMSAIGLGGLIIGVVILALLWL